MPNAALLYCAVFLTIFFPIFSLELPKNTFLEAANCPIDEFSGVSYTFFCTRDS